MQTQTEGNKVPFYASCRKLSIGDPFRWLKMGWQDFSRVPWHSLVYGLVFVFLGWALLYFAWVNENTALIFSLLFGFLIMGPILCFGLYDISHQLEQNRQPSFGPGGTLQHDDRSIDDRVRAQVGVVQPAGPGDRALRAAGLAVGLSERLRVRPGLEGLAGIPDDVRRDQRRLIAAHRRDQNCLLAVTTKRIGPPASAWSNG